jgi:hypothetical protein
MKFPEDIRYAHRIWMSMVLITPIFYNFLLVLFGEISIDAIAIDYVFTVFRNGILLIVYWAILLVLILSVNSWHYTINMKKWIIQLTDIGLISLFFGGLIIFTNDVFDLNQLLLIFSYLIVSSSAIWFFELKSRVKKDGFEIIEHLIEE